jgi:tetratricopeptide (TPR) repeat protein
MNRTNRNILIGVVVVIIVAVLGYFAWKEGGSTAPAISGLSSATSTPVTINVSTSTAATSTSGYTVTPVTIPKATAPVAPSITSPLTFSASLGLTSDQEASLETQFAQVQEVLAKTPADFNAWIALGDTRKEAGDYAGAAADWKYVTELYPNDPTAFANLGDLYGTYLNQPSQGIAFYKQAIKLDPTKEETFYQNLAQIYISEGDTADAKATLEQGINVQVVGYQNLQNMLNSMQ